MVTTQTPTPTREPSARGSSGSCFNSTQWSIVRAASKTDPLRSRAALDALCRTYWRPLYAYVRRSGRSREDAEDLVQGFFAGFLAKNAIREAKPEGGRFRAFLLACLKHYMANEWNRERRQKRGGNATCFSLDWQDAEARYSLESARNLSPDRFYDREWALSLMDQVVDRLREKYKADGNLEQFEHLKCCLTCSRDDIPYQQIAGLFQMTPGAVAVAVHRLRKRYRSLLREEVARTLSSREHLEEEMRALRSALRG